MIVLFIICIGRFVHHDCVPAIKRYRSYQIPNGWWWWLIDTVAKFEVLSAVPIRTRLIIVSVPMHSELSSYNNAVASIVS